MAQQIIRSIGSDGLEVLSNILDKDTGKLIEFKEVSEYYDGTPMSDGKLDAERYLYIKNNGKYYLRVLDNPDKFLEKDTMLDMRNISNTEIHLLKMGYYKGITLNGYYAKGDTPNPIQYNISNTLEVDNGGSIIEAAGLKFVHSFRGYVDVRYFGAKKDEISTSVINNCIQSVDDGSTVVIEERYLVTSADVRENTGIKLRSNINLEINGELAIIPNSMSSYCIVSAYNIENFNIYGVGTIRGSKNTHIAEDDKYYKMYRPTISYSVGDYMAYGPVGYRVTTSGISSNTPPLILDVVVGSVVTNGTVVMEAIDIALGEWGMGISLYEASNFSIRGIKITECWGDGIYIGGKSSTVNPNPGCTNFEVSLIECDDNRRQGMSIVSAEYGRIVSSKFTNTYGTNPQTGVDVEANNWQRVKDIVFDSCYFNDNYEGGFKIYANKPNAMNENVTLINCSAVGNKVGVELRRTRMKNIQFINMTTNYNSTDGFIIREEATDVKLIGLISKYNTGRGVAFNNANNIDIIGSEITNNGISGVTFAGSPNFSEKIRISSSKISNNVAEGLLSSAVRDLVIIDSEFNQNKTGISFNTGNSLNVKISGCSFTNSAEHGVYVNTIQGCSIVDSFFQGNGSSLNDAYSDISVRELSKDALIDKNTFGDNSSYANKVRYNIQLFAGSLDTEVGFNNYKPTSYNTAYLSNTGTNTILYNKVASLLAKGLVNQSIAVSNFPAVTVTTVGEANAAIQNLAAKINAILQSDRDSGQRNS